jgi:hypothetical protein
MSNVKIVEILFTFPAKEATIAAVKAATARPLDQPVKILILQSKHRLSLH